MTRTKMFDGVAYEYEADYDTKETAKAAAATLREDGYLARIAPSDDWGLDGRQWSVYKKAKRA